jgi:hypothetical protein
MTAPARKLCGGYRTRQPNLEPPAARNDDATLPGIDESRQIRAAAIIHEGSNDCAAKSKKRTALDKWG